MKVCFVGSGSIGKRHIKNFIQLCIRRNIKNEVHLLRSSSKKIEGIESLIAKEVYCYERLDKHYDAIFITNPTNLHYNTINMLKHKSNYFFVEKPVFHINNININTLELDKNVYYVACPLRYTSVVLKAKEIINKEDVYSVRVISSSYLPDWRKNVDYRKTYSAHKEQGGGVRIDLIHEWDYLIFLFGRPKEVKSLSGTYSDLDIDSEDIAVYIAQYEDKIIELHLDYFGRKVRRSFEVRTKDHEYIFDIANMEIWQDGRLIERFHDELNDMYIREMENFYDIMSKRRRSNNNLEDALMVLRVTGM